MGARIKLLVVRFKNPLRQTEIRFFRGAVLDRVCGTPHDEFFSGHTEEGLRYSYPLIQYKRIGGKAAIVCIGDGVEAIGEFFSSCDFDLQIGNREPERFEIDSVDAKQILVQAWDDTFCYTLRKWLPFNSNNYNEFLQLEGLAARAEFLQRILVGNILSMCKGLGIRLERDITCEILKMEEPRLELYKGVKMMCFDVEFKTNVSLPDFCGLGKGTSLGMGMVKMMKRNTSPVKKIFLLGGHDLEMLTIKELLEKREDCWVIDKDLSWSNAYLSAYQEELEEYAGMQIYGVELQEDIEVPANYFRIDHHNDYAGLPSALEQVAGCVGISLSRKQQLIAANDKGYIPAMKALFATEEEIVEIRRDDRIAQGVTESDEELAEKTIADNKEVVNDLTIVHALCSRFSPICDRLFPYDKLLIYTDSEWMYYGEGCGRVRELFAVESSLGNLFYGGGEKGYVGVKQNVYNKDEILEMVNRIKNI